ncbi:hypothetical protein D9M68_982650 [compost metagenome]
MKAARNGAHDVCRAMHIGGIQFIEDLEFAQARPGVVAKIQGFESGNDFSEVAILNAILQKTNIHEGGKVS